MTAAETQPLINVPDDGVGRLTCAQICGGNGAIAAPVEMPGIRCVIRSQPSEGGAGGDVYYLSLCGSGLVCRISLADVVGHGEIVSSVSREIHRAIRRFMNWIDHRAVLRRLNRLLVRRGLNAFTTMAVLTYYPPSRRLTYSYAGHLPGWYYCGTAKRWERLTIEDTGDGDRAADHRDCALAVVPDASFSRKARKVTPGDRLLLVTDGVLETFSPDRVVFGADGVDRLLADCHEQPLEQIADALIDRLREHAADTRLAHDDVTLLLLEFTDPPEGPALWHVLRNRVLRPLRLVGDG